MLSTKWLGTPVVGDSCMTRQFCVNWRNGDRPRDVPGRDDTDSNQIRRLSGQECAACKLLPIWEPCQPQNQDRGSGQVWTVRWGLAHELARRPSWQIWTPPNLAFSAPAILMTALCVYPVLIKPQPVERDLVLFCKWNSGIYVGQLSILEY